MTNKTKKENGSEPKDIKQEEQLKQSTAQHDESPSQHDEMMAQNDEALSSPPSEDFKEKWLRSEAELQNLRRRFEQDKKDIRTFAISSFAQDVLSVVDTISLALSHAPSLDTVSDGSLKNVLMGFSMIEKSFASAIERYNIKPIDALQKPFDPAYHEAVMERESDTLPPSSVLEVVQQGYMIGDRLLRPARVIVSKKK